MYKSEKLNNCARKVLSNVYFSYEDYLNMNLRRLPFTALVIFMLMTTATMAQRKLAMVSVEAGNAITAYPVVGFPQLFYSNFHPFVTVGTGFIWSEQKLKKHRWEQTFNIGYIYHRYVQHSIPLFTELVYRLKTGDRFALGAHLGLGYLQSIPATDRFQLNSAGVYEEINNLGRAQGMAKVSFSGTYKLNDKLALSMNYGMLFQGPFVNSYVPVLPYNTFQLGIQKSLKKRR